MPVTRVVIISDAIVAISFAEPDKPFNNDLIISTPSCNTFGTYSAIFLTMFANTSPTAPASPVNPPSFTASVNVLICAVPNCTVSRSKPLILSDTPICKPSTAEWKIVISPCKLSSIVCACVAAEPMPSLALANPSLNSLTFSVLETVIILKAFKPCDVKIAPLYAFASSSLIPDKAPFNSSTTSLKSLALPSAS